MISYSLTYTPEAEKQLARCWLSASDRQAITKAQHEIDAFLFRDPRNPGREASEGLWNLVVPPLVAIYEIDDANRLVTVTGFGLLKQ